MSMNWNEAFASCPLVAILRGVAPAEVLGVSETLFNAGFRIIEIPLNSPDALVSVRLTAEAFHGRAVIGAGTVLTSDQARAVKDAGGRLVVAPNFNPAVAAVCAETGLSYGPGVATATEAFAAFEAGARFLKLFPAEMIPPAAVRALRAVLPREALVLPVGGVTLENMAGYRAAGANGFGLGSSLYSTQKSLAALSIAAVDFVRQMS
jgi:2-dehydro-3-deoxyphosphogalactonate aldolase